ncbi:hypothetical protein B0H11DRAFT_753294 [Mycena galericulata]|nr:hypothetical protein B0H11DRAFT_753294 [Mycena galericulata]
MSTGHNLLSILHFIIFWFPSNSYIASESDLLSLFFCTCGPLRGYLSALMLSRPSLVANCAAHNLASRHQASLYIEVPILAGRPRASIASGCKFTAVLMRRPNVWERARPLAACFRRSLILEHVANTIIFMDRDPDPSNMNAAIRMPRCPNLYILATKNHSLRCFDRASYAERSEESPCPRSLSVCRVVLGPQKVKPVLRREKKALNNQSTALTDLF